MHERGLARARAMGLREMSLSSKLRSFSPASIATARLLVLLSAEAPHELSYMIVRVLRVQHATLLPFQAATPPIEEASAGAERSASAFVQGPATSLKDREKNER